MKEFGDIRMAFGESDEMSFIINKASTLYGEPDPTIACKAFVLLHNMLSNALLSSMILFVACGYPSSFDGRHDGPFVTSESDLCIAPGRRKSKLISLLVSCFTAHYIVSWPNFFLTKRLQHLPIFDGRAVCYPTDQTLRDYLCWRQADTHINNQVSHKLDLAHELTLHTIFKVRRPTQALLVQNNM